MILKTKSDLSLLHGEPVAIKLCIDSEDFPMLHAKLSCDPETGESRDLVSDLHSFIEEPSQENIRKDIEDFLDLLIRSGVTGISRDYWDDTLDGHRINTETRRTLNPLYINALSELREVSKILDEELTIANNKLLD